MAGTAVMASQPTSLIKMKAGECRFTILESDGLSRVENYNINIRPEDEQSNRKRLELITAADGTVETTLASGRYVVDINGSDIAVLQTTKADTTTDFRFVLPEVGLAESSESGTTGLQIGVSGTKNATGVIVVDSLSSDANTDVVAINNTNGREGVAELQRPRRTRTRTRTTGRNNTRQAPAVRAPVPGTIERPFSPSVPPPVSP